MCGACNSNSYGMGPGADRTKDYIEKTCYTVQVVFPRTFENKEFYESVRK